MNWLPALPDFKERLRAALEHDDPREKITALSRIAQSRLKPIEHMQLDNALRPLVADAASTAAEGFTSTRVAVLSSCTADHLAPAIRIAALRRRIVADVWVGGFGQYRTELVDPASRLVPFRPATIVLSLTAHDLLNSVAIDAREDEAERAIDVQLDELRALWRRARDGWGATVVQQSFLDAAEPLFGSLDSRVPGSPHRLVARLNERIRKAAAEDGVVLLDVARGAARDGLDAWFDIRHWLQAKMEVAPAAAPRYGELLARVLAAQAGRSRKCLVLDLDNTLWGGVVGDDGVEGLVLGHGSARGEAHLALQRYALQLRNRGVILAVCSKNDAAIAQAAFRDHPEMALKLDDVAAFVANWEDKAENLRGIARQLNIGLDSLVFVDDNPAERERVRDALPEVAVPELPDDPSGFVRCIAEAGYFEAIHFTDEDRQRASQYTANTARDALREAATNVDDFLRGLDMSVIGGPVETVDVARVVQLINKTNQFNTTTRRVTDADFGRFRSDDRNLALQFRLLDRFGDNGLVSVMLLSPLGDEAMQIDNWVMSCRVFGRQLEDEAINFAAEAALARGYRALVAEFRPTAKNGVIGDLYRRLGFARVDAGEVGGRAAAADPPNSLWRLDLTAWGPRPTFIRRTARSAERAVEEP